MALIACEGEMPDDIKAGETPETNDPKPNTDGETPEGEAKPDDAPPWGDDFDAERAWNTIQKLRAFEDTAGKLQKELDRIKDEQAQQEREAKEADEQRLAEQEKWQDLAEKRKERLLELEPLEPKVQSLEAERDAYKQALQAHVDAQLEGLPESVTELLADMSPIKQLEWLGKHRDSYLKGHKAQGVPDTPSPNGTAQLSPEEKRRLAAIPGRDY